MTCTNNSTISGILVSGVVADSGKRLSFQQNTSINWDPLITVGDIIRYDVDSTKFTRSIANPSYDSNGLSNAEVVGVVESISQTAGITYATVVTHGLINYPNLLSTISGISATSGGIGGTDIFFLSPTVPGGITSEISDGNRYIAKPVLQVCPTSDVYNAVVVNYLGYETSQSADYTVGTTETSVGEIRLININSDVPYGWIDCSFPRTLLRSNYPDAFTLYYVNYGSIETITVSNGAGYVNSLVGKFVAPIDPSNGQVITPYAEVIYADALNSNIRIKHLIGETNIWNSNYTQYKIRPSDGESTFTVTYGTVTEFSTPQITTNISATSNNFPFALRTILRVKPDSRVSYLPDSVSFNSASINGILSIPGTPNVSDTIGDLLQRVTAIEQRLGG
jgi:hypothetical protein